MLPEIILQKHKRLKEMTRLIYEMETVDFVYGQGFDDDYVSKTVATMQERFAELERDYVDESLKSQGLVAIKLPERKLKVS